MNFAKYQLEKKEVSYDDGITWVDVLPMEVREIKTENEYETEDECTEGSPIVSYRWVETNDYLCDGLDKYLKEQKEMSTDGINWVEINEYRQGRLLESSSTDCVENEYVKQYFTIESLEDDNEIYFRFYHLVETSSLSLSASTDGGVTWSVFTYSGDSFMTIGTLSRGQKMLLKGTLLKCPELGTFNSSKRINAMGNTYSLAYGDNYLEGYKKRNGLSISNLFNNCMTLISAENLILTRKLFTSPDDGLSGVFSYCTNLTTPPKKIDLADMYGKNNCLAMFQGCTSLLTAPELPRLKTATTACYAYMFKDCRSLKEAPELLATTLESQCYQSMFEGCTSLTAAPELRATTLANRCYERMFYGCTNLDYIKAMFTTTPSDTYTKLWVGGVSSSGTFVKNENATWDVRGQHGIPDGWTVTTE